METHPAGAVANWEGGCGQIKQQSCKKFYCKIHLCYISGIMLHQTSIFYYYCIRISMLFICVLLAGNKVYTTPNIELVHTHTFHEYDYYIYQGGVTPPCIYVPLLLHYHDVIS